MLCEQHEALIESQRGLLRLMGVGDKPSDQIDEKIPRAAMPVEPHVSAALPCKRCDDFDEVFLVGFPAFVERDKRERVICHGVYSLSLQCSSPPKLLGPLA